MTGKPHLNEPAMHSSVAWCRFIASPLILWSNWPCPDFQTITYELNGEAVRFCGICLLPRNFFEKGATGVFVRYTAELEEANTEPRL